MDGAYNEIDHTDPTLVRVVAWATHPFSSDMSALKWVLWIGLILVAVWLWTRVLGHFVD